jgi:hypothetical protein
MEKETYIEIETNIAINFVNEQVDKGVEVEKAKNKAFNNIKSLVKPYVVYRVNKHFFK